MSDVELLFLVLALIYTWECACWLPLGSTAFLAWFESRWKVAAPASILGNQKGGFVFAPFLPPLGTIFTSHPWLAMISPHGVLAVAALANGTPEAGLNFSFDDIRKVEVEGKKVRINDKLFVKASSATLALHLARQLRDLLKLKAAAREAALQKLLRESFEVKTIKQRLADFLTRTATLRMLCNVLFVYLFIFAPAIIWRLGFALAWPALLIDLFILTFTIAFLFRRIHKHLYPAAEDDRFTHFLINMFSPATTIRARDVLSRPLLETFHPLAIAKVLCPEAEFKSLGRAALLDLRYPLPSKRAGSAPASHEIEDYFRAHYQAAVEEFLKQNALKADEILRPPSPTDETCLSYCPRCQAQFTFSEGNCPDCNGLALIPFKSANGRIAKN